MTRDKLGNRELALCLYPAAAMFVLLLALTFVSARFFAAPVPGFLFCASLLVPIAMAFGTDALIHKRELAKTRTF
jgi:hypothetical protein